MTNQVTPHNVRPVDTTVSELEPGTIFRVKDCKSWMYRVNANSGVSAIWLDSDLFTSCRNRPVVEIADSVTIGPEVTSG